MKKVKVLILGVTGMLGRKVFEVFSKDKKIELFYGFNSADFNYLRVKENITRLKRDIEGVYNYSKPNYIINCIGVTKPMIGNDIKDHSATILVNSMFPHILVECVPEHVKILQIATDCVFSGCEGQVKDEDSAHTSRDIYGKTKSLGEVIGKQNFYNFRTSIVGPQVKEVKFLYLYEWFKRNDNMRVMGFENHLWNGISTLAFAKIMKGLINDKLEKGCEFPHWQHIVPKNYVSKYELLEMWKKLLNKKIEIKKSGVGSYKTDMRLCTMDENTNKRLWKLGGYKEIPTIYELMEEMVNDDRGVL